MQFRLVSGVTVENFMDDAILIDAENNVFVLNKTALFFWQALSDGVDLHSLHSSFEDAEEAKVHGDLELFLQQLVEYGLVERVSEPQQ